MSQNVLLKVQGLATFPNHLSSVPSGGLLKASNIVVNRENVAESRRGYKLYGAAMGSGSTTTAHQLLTYKNRMFRHWGVSSGTTIDYDSDGSGTFTQFSISLIGDTHTTTTIDGFTNTSTLEKGMFITGTGIPANTKISSIINNNSIIISNAATATNAGISFTFTKDIEEVQLGLRLKSLEANSNLYFTSSNGIQKISANVTSDLTTATITDAGGIKALDLQATLNSQPGFFSQNSVVAYRLVWGVKDANQNLILGSPSSRAVIANPITSLLIGDFNELLAKLDTLSLSTGIKAQTYLANYKVSSSGSPSTLRTNLISLATAIDNDIAGFSVSNATWSTNVATLTVSTNPTNIISVGDTITVNGIVCAPAAPNLYNGNFTVTGVTPTTLTYTVTSTAGTYSSAGTVKRTKYSSISQPVALSLSPTSDELQSMQTYYNAIVTDLQNETSGVITDPTPFDTSNATTSATVDLSFVVPSGVTLAHFYQIYRTAITTAATGTVLSSYDPGDEEQLVFEDNPTLADLNAGFITVQDVTTDAFRGANLYTNPNSGDGILQANEVPPLAHDIAAFKGYIFYANTQTKQSLNLSMLSVSQLISGTSTFTITSGSTTNTYTFVAGVNQSQSITTVADVGGNLHSKYFTLSSGNNLRNYYIWYNNGSGIDPAISGKTGVEVVYVNNDSNSTIATKTSTALQQYGDFTVTVLGHVITINNNAPGISTQAANGTASPGFSYTMITPGQGEDATNKKVLISSLSTPSQQVDETSRSLVRVINRNASDVVNAFYLSGPSDVPGLLLFEARHLSQAAFHLNVNSTATGGQFDPAIPTSGTSSSSDDEIKPNRVYFSKYQQPEAVPIVNFIDVGPQDSSILRILALRDNLFILKEEGVYRLSGLVSPFNVTLFDSSTLLKGPDSAVVLNNLIYMYSSQGVATISDTGVSVISRPIENLLVSLSSSQFTHFSTSTFGVAYESDRSYYLSTVTNTFDTFATQCFRYNTFTNSWTVLDISKRSGIVNPFDDSLYLSPNDTNFIEKERKTFDRTDYADREISLTLATNAVSGTTLTLPSLTNISAGDVLVQTQHLTISQYIQILSKLDRDSLLTDRNYVSTLSPSAGVNLSNSVDDLINKIANDAGRLSVTSHTSAATYTALTPTGASFSAQQTNFNSLVTLLNNDVGTGYKNYFPSSLTTDYEFVILSTNKNQNSIVSPYVYPLIAGPIIVYNHINVMLEWVPQYFQDVSMTKQVSEGSLIFEDSSFSVATLSYATDLSADLENQDINGFGNGIFGNLTYGQGLYGGNGSGIPFRTLIPKEKQRCRYMNVQFSHNIARESFALYGLSLTFTQTSPRGWR